MSESFTSQQVPPVVAVSSSAELDQLATLIEGLGPSVIRYPHGARVDDSLPLERWLGALVEGEFDDVVFATAQGVNLIVEVARQLEREPALFKALSLTRKISKGANTARALSTFGLAPDISSPAKDVGPLLTILEQMNLRDRSIGVQPCDRKTEELIIRTLENQGARAVRVAGASSADPEALEVLSLFSRHRPSAVVFAIKSQLSWLFDALRVAGRERELRRLLHDVVLIASQGAAEFLRERDLVPDHTFGFAQLSHPQAADMMAALNLVNCANSTRHVSRQNDKQQLVIVGNGMVGHHLCKRMVERDADRVHELTVFGEEPYAAYNRVDLSQYFTGANEHSLVLSPREWYAKHRITLYSAERVISVDRNRRAVTSSNGRVIHYDQLVFATGSSPLVPPVPGMDKAGVFVYRTIDDLKSILRYRRSAESCAVLGAGLLGLEAAKACVDMGLVTHLVESESRLMPRQLDSRGARLLERSISAVGIQVHLGVSTRAVLGEHRVRGLRFADGQRLDVDMLIVAAGIRPRDELARAAGLAIARRGGILVNEQLQTSDARIYALGECAIYGGMLFGLAQPGFEMADVLSAHLTGERVAFTGADLSTRLSLSGVDVASIGDPFADAGTSRSIVFEDQVKGIYKKLVVTHDGSQLVGSVLVGDSSQFEMLRGYLLSGHRLDTDPATLLVSGPDSVVPPVPRRPPTFGACTGPTTWRAECRGAASPAE